MEQKKFSSAVEMHYFKESERECFTTKLPYIVVSNFPSLGQMTSLRFLEWVSKNPNGVVSLPTGKTPEHFIRWTQYHLANWDTENSRKIREENGLFLDKKPSLENIRFFQID